jgi:hypothetical protein
MITTQCTICSQTVFLNDIYEIYHSSNVYTNGFFRCKDNYPIVWLENNNTFIICSIKCAKRFQYAWMFKLDTDWDDIEESDNKRYRIK